MAARARDRLEPAAPLAPPPLMATCLRTLSTSKGLNIVSAIVHPRLAASHSRCHGVMYVVLGGGDGVVITWTTAVCSRLFVQSSAGHLLLFSQPPVIIFQIKKPHRSVLGPSNPRRRTAPTHRYNTTEARCTVSVCSCRNKEARRHARASSSSHRGGEHALGTARRSTTTKWGTTGRCLVIIITCEADAAPPVPTARHTGSSQDACAAAAAAPNDDDSTKPAHHGTPSRRGRSPHPHRLHPLRLPHCRHERERRRASPRGLYKRKSRSNEGCRRK